MTTTPQIGTDRESKSKCDDNVWAAHVDEDGDLGICGTGNGTLNLIQNGPGSGAGTGRRTMTMILIPNRSIDASPWQSH